ncbi:MAG: GH116 family glycosyl hydrolase [Bacteroidia bacterium]|nr:GH116 family glycosyl hydrolase [Bacteroidia bacterium]
MKKFNVFSLFRITVLSFFLVNSSCERNSEYKAEHAFNGSYSGKYLDHIAFPIGGIGAGMFCMEGTGSISHLSINNKPELYNEPFAFAAISVKGIKNEAKVLEAPVPEWKFFGPGGTANGAPGKNYGLPRFETGRFLARFPFAALDLEDKDIPLTVEVLGWSPFIPTDADNSSLPVGVMEYTFKNTSSKAVEAVFSWNSRNFVSEGNGRIMKADNGFTLTGNPADTSTLGKTGFTAFVNDSDAVVDYCWFRGEWFDPHIILWKNIENSLLPDNPPVETSAPGASIYFPFKLKPGEEKTVAVNFCWYLPQSNLSIGNVPGTNEKLPCYSPWYAARFQNLGEVVKYWAQNYPEGCCPGSCTHVWNYAQALPHLFPSLERTLRETEFKVSQNEQGHQNFRSNLPISEPPHNFYAAADGQLGGIMKVYRDWRISGNTEWMTQLFPLVKKSLDYCIGAWDPGRKGYLEEPHHNTYDIEFWGPDGMCTSFYLGAMTAIIEMSKAVNAPCDQYQTLLKKGKLFMESELFDGEYFIQKVIWEGLRSPNPVEAAQGSYRTTYTPEALELLNKEGPKYQYGKGCLSDGIIGMWMATVCGLDEAVENEKVTSHLIAVHKYNFRNDLTDHINPQRPTFAAGKEGGLLLCTWPKGDQLSLPFIYSNEVWTGIEYQVASHLMFKGEVEKGLDIVRECRKRYDGRVRNPFNEYECGSWYARAMSSYALIEGLTGVRYDAVDRLLYIDSRIGDFTSFLSTETGFGTVGLKNGIPFLKVVYGSIDALKVIVSGVVQIMSPLDK